ncbi:MAG: M14 family zinc carboxypeptidase [Gemmatimonadota bacterium]|nr:M14 family zinc carboxypeptidase [Gemmatimonadota bacterium]
MSRISRLILAPVALLCAAQVAGAQQAIDQEYTKKIKEHLQDARISTELVDHLPASSRVPTPLKFLGRIVGTPGELTYAKDIHRYLDAVAKASNGRAKFWTIGKTEEGRDMVMMAIADEATIASLDKYKGMLKELTDPRRTSEAEAQRVLKSAKPIYWITSGLHSPENGGPEMLMELAYRLVVDESAFYQNIRKNVITFITPVIEVDGREKQVDTYYFNKKRPAGEARLPLMYWGKYVQHDNNRDGMGQFLAITRNTTKTFLEWTPTIMHDLHESVTYLYASTGSGPYNEAVDAITVNEWWNLANNEVMEMTKRGVPGVWTYGFYDGWTPNYLFFIAHSHNAVGRFYEAQSYGPDNYVVRPPATTTSREWFRPNPPLPSINWGPRNNTNIQQSALLLSLSHVAKNRALFVENYWLKNKRSVDKGKNGPTFAWVIPAGQHKKADAADAVNDLMLQGLEFHRATSAFKAGSVQVQPGDYIIRADQPYRTLADMYFSLQNFSPSNPSPYDDTGWTFPLMRNLTIAPVSDKAILEQPMTPITGEVVAAGGVEGTGSTIVVAATSDNNLVTFRFKNADVKMAAAEEEFEAGGKKFAAGSFIIANADRAKIEPQLKALGLSGTALASAPTVKSHDLDVPRIGYLHSWTRTQDEGWVRAALDHYGVPYTYFADQLLRTMPNLRAKYDVIIYPHVSGTPQSMVAGMAGGGSTPLPYKKSAETPNLGAVDSSDDIRGGMGLEGLMNLYKFVQEGGTLITEGATTGLFPEYNLTTGVTVETPADLFVRGSILRGIIADKKSPLTYGYAGSQMPVYFNTAPVLNAGMAMGGGFGGGRSSTMSQNVTPMAMPLKLSPWDASTASAAAPAGAGDRGGRGAGGGGGMGGFGAMGGATTERPRVILSFPTNADEMLLSGTLVNGQALSGRAQLVDAPLGKGHVVMFAIRPFWRWQTQGTYSLGFNALMNWNDLDAGKR